MKDDRMKEVLNRIARRNIPEDVNLMPRIAARLEGKSMMKILRTRPLLAILMVLLLLAILSGVAYAIGRTFGFRPGMGVFETPSLRQLAEPVSMEQDGFRVTVTEAAVDSNHTVIRYEVIRLSPPPTNGEYDTSCQGTPGLTLPDGSLVGLGFAAPAGKGILENGYWYRMEFPALPAGSNDASLLIPCLVPLSPGPLPRDWQFSLHFIPWDGTPLAPVYQVPTQPAAPTGTFAGSSPIATDYGITFSLGQVIELDKGYHFEGSASWTDSNIQAGSPSPYAAHLTDAAGHQVALDWAPPQIAPSGNMRTRWAFESREKPTAFPLTLTLEGYTLTIAAQTSFSLDLGPNPQPGQTWNLNLGLPVSGHVLHIQSATAFADTDITFLEFELSSDENVFGAGLFDLKNTQGQGGGGGGVGEPQTGPFIARVYYGQGLPSGVVPISVASLDIVVRTPWQTTWQP